MEDKIEIKIEKILEKINSIDRTLIRNTITLEEHIKRTKQNELLIERIFEDVEPVKKHVHVMEGAFKLLGFTALILSVIGGILKIIGIL